MTCSLRRRDNDPAAIAHPANDAGAERPDAGHRIRPFTEPATHGGIRETTCILLLARLRFVFIYTSDSRGNIFYVFTFKKIKPRSCATFKAHPQGFHLIQFQLMSLISNSNQVSLTAFRVLKNLALFLNNGLNRLLSFIFDQVSNVARFRRHLVVSRANSFKLNILKQTGLTLCAGFTMNYCAVILEYKTNF